MDLRKSETGCGFLPTVCARRGLRFDSASYAGRFCCFLEAKILNSVYRFLCVPPRTFARGSKSLPGKAFVILRAGPRIFSFLERLSPFVRFLRFGNLIPHLIIFGAVIAPAKGRHNQDEAN